MRKPEIILFDFGETLIHEEELGVERGAAALVERACANPHGYTPRQLQDLADEMNRALGRLDKETRETLVSEVHNRQFWQYLFEYSGLAFDCGGTELELLFWDAAVSKTAQPGMAETLRALDDAGIRTGVVSNMGFSGETLRTVIGRMFPEHRFEFIMASSEYVFRKPNRLLFDLALRKAGVAAEEAWYCGDNPVCDLWGAHNAGVFPVWYSGGRTKADPGVPFGYLRIDHWDELHAVLEWVEQER